MQRRHAPIERLSEHRTASIEVCDGHELARTTFDNALSIEALMSGPRIRALLCAMCDYV